jgi:hypothetical protein
MSVQIAKWFVLARTWKALLTTEFAPETSANHRAFADAF